MAKEFPYYVIVFRPSDFPGTLYLVRKWHFERGESVALEVVGTAVTLMGARKLVPDGLVLLPKDLNDDPVIVECWV